MAAGFPGRMVSRPLVLREAESLFLMRLPAPTHDYQPLLPQTLLHTRP